jgi:hypothetical protein
MEIGLNFSYWLQNLDANAQMLIFFAAFGIPVIMLLLALFQKLFGWIGLKAIVSKSFSIIYMALTITWLIGFVFSIFLFFAGAPGIKIILILIVIFICMFIFTLTHYPYLNKFMKEYTNSETDK